MTLSVRAFWVPKEGNTVEEYEDAFDYSITERRFAVADGATESSFAGRWSQSLVQGFTAAPPFRFSGRATLLRSQQFDGSLILPRCELQKWLEPLQHVWRESIDWEHLPWFAVEKAQAGAFSSLLGLAFTEGFRWHAIAVGDSCLFQVSDESLLAAFPLSRAEQFGNRPLLLSSNPANNRRVWDEVWFDEGNCHPDDLFLLITDALAHWFLAQHEADAKPWATLCGLKTEEEFASFVAHLRQERLMRNDDVTLLVVRPGCNERGGTLRRACPTQGAAGRDVGKRTLLRSTQGTAGRDVGNGRCSVLRRARRGAT